MDLVPERSANVYAPFSFLPVGVSTAGLDMLDYGEAQTRVAYEHAAGCDESAIGLVRTNHNKGRTVHCCRTGDTLIEKTFLA